MTILSLDLTQNQIDRVRIALRQRYERTGGEIKTDKELSREFLLHYLGHLVFEEERLAAESQVFPMLDTTF